MFDKVLNAPIKTAHEVTRGVNGLPLPTIGAVPEPACTALFGFDSKRVVLLGGAVLVGLGILVGITTFTGNKRGQHKNVWTIQVLRTAADNGDASAMYSI